MTASKTTPTAVEAFYPNKFRDVLYGCAYGDAWGNRNEFQSYKRLTANDKRGPELPTQLIVTDDTQMTLSLARAIHTAGTHDLDALRAAVITEFVTWRSDPDNNRAPGNTCMGATAALAAGRPWNRATVVNSDGCGTVMRTSPAAFLPKDLWRPVAAWQAATTHGKASGIAATLITTGIIREAVAGCVHAGNMLGYAIELASHPALRAGVGEWLAGHPLAPTATDADALVEKGMGEVVEVLKNSYAARGDFRRDPWSADPCAYGGEGWRAPETLAVALLCVDALPDSPVDALRRATVTNGDSDSIAAVAGAILGAAHTNPWPTQWATRLEPRYRAWLAEAADYQFSS